MSRTSLFIGGRKLAREDDEVVESTEPVEITDVREDDDALNESMVDTDEAVADLTEAFDVKEEAEEKVAALEALSPEEYTPYIAKDAAMYYKNLCKRTGMEHTAISTEDVDQTVKLSTEDIKEFIAKIVAAIKAIIAKIVTFFKKLFGMAADVVNNDEKVAQAESEKIKQITYKKPEVKKDVNEINNELNKLKVEDVIEVTKNEDAKSPSIKALREKMEKLIADDKEILDAINKLRPATEDYDSNIMAVIKSYASIVERNLGLLTVGKLYKEKIDVENYYKTISDSTNASLKEFVDIIKNNTLEKILKESEDHKPNITELEELLTSLLDSIKKHCLVKNFKVTSDQINSTGFLNHDIASGETTVVPIAVMGKTVTFLMLDSEKFTISMHKTTFAEKGLNEVKNELAGEVFKGMLSIDNGAELLNMIKKNKESIAIISKYGNEALSTLNSLSGIMLNSVEKIDVSDSDIEIKKEAISFIKSYTTVIPSLSRVGIEQLIYVDKTIIKMFNHNRYLVQMGL